MAKKNKHVATKVESIRHKDKRTNIPTEELRDFVADEELAPKTMLYPRDPSLDPQLVWKGKDEQDREDLAVPVVPIYIQEKIHPQAIIDALPRIEQPGERSAATSSPTSTAARRTSTQKVDFYHHEQNWTNRLILGDSLLVMTSLAEKEGLKGKVQMIYLDPPYGIKFGSNWQVSTRKRDVKDGKAEDATRQPDRSGPSATPGNSASTPTWPTCATGWWSPATCSPRPAASLCRSGTRMCIWCDA